MSLSDFNPAILIGLGFITLAALGKFIGAIQRARFDRYDIREDDR